MSNVTQPALYQAALRRRDRSERAAKTARFKRARATAHAASEVLRTEFGAARVVVFGSLVEEDGAWFGARSDIDLAAWAIAPEDFFDAVARLETLSAEFEIDLVAMERCPPHLVASIDRHGVAL
jgi:predicted nucleotidyltransferase